MTLRIAEAELVRDVRAVLENVERGNEVIIEREDHRPLAVMKQPEPVGRKISECIALAKAYEEKLSYAPVPDADFARDVQEGIDAHREPIRNVWDDYAHGSGPRLQRGRNHRAPGTPHQHPARGAPEAAQHNGDRAIRDQCGGTRARHLSRPVVGTSR
jgi:hypothetical protein